MIQWKTDPIGKGACPRDGQLVPVRAERYGGTSGRNGGEGEREKDHLPRDKATTEIGLEAGDTNQPNCNHQPGGKTVDGREWRDKRGGGEPVLYGGDGKKRERARKAQFGKADGERENERVKHGRNHRYSTVPPQADPSHPIWKEMARGENLQKLSKKKNKIIGRGCVLILLGSSSSSTVPGYAVGQCQGWS